MEYNPITVTDLNKYIKNKIDGDEMLNNVLVKGEISNFKNHYTGHMYFTLKDESSLIKCVMFKSYTTHLSFMPKDGMKVMVLGSVAVFERDGVYQIYAKAMKEDGLGSLYTAYEELKKKLKKNDKTSLVLQNQIYLIEDIEMNQQIIGFIENEHLCADAAVDRTCSLYADIFASESQQFIIL